MFLAEIMYGDVGSFRSHTTGNDSSYKL